MADTDADYEALDDATAAAIEAVDVDADDPYAAVDVDALPEWWRRAIVERERHDQGTYLPARLRDGAVAKLAVDAIEREYDVDVRFVGVDAGPGDAWEIRVDGETVDAVAKRRRATGDTVFDVSRDELEDLVAERTG